MRNSKKETILIVNNEITNLSVLFTELHQANFRVIVVENGNSALKRIQRIQPDIMLLDVKLPDIDGFELCQRLREKEGFAQIPIIFLTVMSDTASKIRRLGLTAVDYISEPFDPKKVVARVERHLTLRKLQKKVQEKNAQLENEIAQRKRVEAELRRYQEHLEELVEQRTAQLQATNEALIREMAERERLMIMLIRTSKLAAASRLTASVAHEINNPLQSVIGLLSLVYEKLTGKTEIKTYLSVIDSELRRVAHIVNGMRDLYRPENEQKTDTNVNAVLEQLLILVRKQSQENGVELIWEATDVPTIKLVATQMNQLFLNILLNGIDACQRGCQLRVRTEYTPEPAGIRIQFSDNGIGMEKKQIDKIFDPFYTTKSNGLGLGLAVCFNIIEQHDGYIEVDSQLGEGSTFTIWLPDQ